MRHKNSKRGFTLVETIVASTILCGAVLTIGAICSRSLTSTRLNRRYETALTLIDRQLNLIDYIGIDEFIAIGQMQGSFEDYAPGYTWTVMTQYEDIDSLYLVTITVSWLEQNRPHNVTVETMFDGVSMYATSGTQTGTQTTQ
jgi:prepilin-type N-terminal cleavage/methylation domain-containing protein